MLGAVLIYSGVSWMVSARKWFKGPVQQVSNEELAELEVAYKAHTSGAVGDDKITMDAVAAPVNEIGAPVNA